ncbi:ABC transporter permease [Oricola thermophila]|uniref:ABC transporter permease n=2 Tax=Oricola thermophila TaxID=2742145 RepID=A0A6N1VB95_9HYPH|nr:ABC transporter permease [Oricola thermophila]
MARSAGAAVTSMNWLNKMRPGAGFPWLAFGFLALLLICVVFGSALAGSAATKMNLGARMVPPGTLEGGFLNILGTDSLGRSMLARLAFAARMTLLIAGSAVLFSLVVGGTLGLISGYFGGVVGAVLMRIADILQSFPAVLLAIVVLYIFGSGPLNIVMVLAVTRAPVYLRTARALTLELRTRLFTDAARSFGGSGAYILRRHITPIVVPTLLSIATVDFAVVMLAEAGLSFLGIGIQPPDVTWGLMVSQGRTYVAQAWWLAFLPGLAIMLTALSANIVSNWFREQSDGGDR